MNVRSTVVDHEVRGPVVRASEPETLADDARWQLAQRVVASRQFARSSLLSKFLLYIVAESVDGRAGEISEHQIGVHVFDRPASYRTVEDNIVRNYARQLRRRLAEYFGDEGVAEPLHIDVPLGGYVPVFSPVAEPVPDQANKRQGGPIAIGPESPPSSIRSASMPRRSGTRLLLFAFLLGVYSAILVGTGWIAGSDTRAPAPIPAAAPTVPTTPLWNALFGGSSTTYIVPADAGLNLLEDLSRQPLALADYIDDGYARVPLPVMDAHSEEDLRMQRFTSFVDMQIMSALAQLPEYNPQRVILRFPRDLRVDDLRNANAIILGSVGSDPWAAVAEGHANFRIVYRNGMQGATIVNSRPMPGEAAQYVSHWNEPAHETFALISCLPNLSGNGRLLILQGLDVAGTQAAADALFHPAAIAQILRRATRSNDSLGYFEILLRSTSLESSATRIEVIGSRVY